MVSQHRILTKQNVFVLTLLVLRPLAVDAQQKSPETLQFNRHIRPLLSKKCLNCHGPDSAAREAELRIDDADDVRKDRDGHRVIVPGKPDTSEFYRRLVTTDEDERMPPADSGLTLSPAEIDLFRRWIEQGAPYEAYWSFIRPLRPALPPNKQRDWVRNPIDAFLLARLEKEGLQPSPQADRATLFRRVSLDLTGLPPTLKQLDAFLADKSADAYEKAVDRLLASKQFGEHRARYWLDAARYADTNGFFTDDERQMWQWRDWVIDAFNTNMPFDRFTVEQLAGDLLPKPTVPQRIATGFNRNHMTTHETGVIDEEYRVEYVIDRLQTTSTVWLGLSMGCARCHEHKFDPISQKEFYQLFAFFNTLPEKGNTGSAGNASPTLNVPTPDYQQQLDTLTRQSQAADKQLKQVEPDLQAAQSHWERQVLSNLPPPTDVGLVAHYDMQHQGADASRAKHDATPNGTVEYVPAMLGTAARFNSDAVLEAPGVPAFDRTDAFSYAAWIRPASGRPACVLSKNDDAQGLRGFDLMLRKGKAVVHLINKWKSDAIQIVTQQSVSTNRWRHVLVTYDGSSRAAGVRIYFDGVPQPVDVRLDHLTASFKTDQPLRIGRRSTSAAFEGLIDDVRLYNRALSSDEARHVATSQLLRGLLAVPAEKRTREQKATLRSLFLTETNARRFRDIDVRAVALRKQLQKLKRELPTTMVMQEMDKPRKTFYLERGQYDEPGETVTATVPASLPPLPKGAPANRLGFARWLVDPAHPLTARVTMNRFWQQFFGTGIVKTVEDIGTQSEWPSHPDLIDWLAVEFVESGWDVKHMQRLIVTSAAYRQSSRVSAELLDRDPENRLLARGPRFRLDAEVVRDNALAIGGLLVNRVGGASVKPYQPQGLWEAVSYDGGLSYPQDQGDGLYRRSLYTYWKRQSPPPAMLAFDAPTRETCTVRRPRTNTPLQALVLLNDPTYIEAARRLAERMLTEPNDSPAARIRFAFRTATSRTPEADEVAILLDVYRQQLDLFRKDKTAANKLLDVGESPRNTKLKPAEHAAWTTVASMILNMDETVTKN